MIYDNKLAYALPVWIAPTSCCCMSCQPFAILFWWLLNWCASIKIKLTMWIEIHSLKGFHPLSTHLCPNLNVKSDLMSFIIGIHLFFLSSEIIRTLVWATYTTTIITLQPCRGPKPNTTIFSQTFFFSGLRKSPNKEKKLAKLSYKNKQLIHTYIQVKKNLFLSGVLSRSQEEMGGLFNVPCDLAQSLLTKRVEGFFIFFFFFLQVMGFAIIAYLTPDLKACPKANFKVFGIHNTYMGPIIPLWKACVSCPHWNFKEI